MNLQRDCRSKSMARRDPILTDLATTQASGTTGSSDMRNEITMVFYMAGMATTTKQGSSKLSTTTRIPTKVSMQRGSMYQHQSTRGDNNHCKNYRKDNVTLQFGRKDICNNKC